MIHLPGYTLEEKVRIAESYLIPKQMAKNGVTSEHILLPRSTVLRVASSYTREAGVRQLEREFAALCRHVALQVCACAHVCLFRIRVFLSHSDASVSLFRCVFDDSLVLYSSVSSASVIVDRPPVFHT